MDAKAFFSEFGHLASAPSGVDQLRHLVMALALRGDLLKPNENLPLEIDRLVLESATAYFRQRGRRAVPHHFAEPIISELSIPDGWRWKRVGELCDLQTGATPSTMRPDYYGGDIRWLVSGDVNRGTITDCDGRISDLGLKNSNCKVLPIGTVVIALNGQGKTRASVALLKVPAACNQSLVGMIPLDAELLMSEYLLLALRFRYREIRDITGQKQRRGLNMGLVSELSVPLPPIVEQRKVVAKVDELMALCDKLEAQQQQRAKLRFVTRRAACDELVRTRPARGLRSAWHRMHAGMKLWMDVPDSVDDVEEALGYLGCMGVLNGFDSQTNAVAADQQQRALPPGWRWTELGDLAEYITSGSRGWRAYAATKGDVFIRSQDIKHDELRFEDQAFVALPEKAEGKRTLVREGDLLMTITGANVGKCAQMPRLGSRAYVNQHVALVRVKDVRQTPFLHAWITNAHGGRKHLARFIYGDKPGLNLPQVAGIPVPLPPQEVQDRIVQNLRHYGELCGRLAAQLGEARRLSQALAQASVAAITGLSAEEHTPMKTPKTELISNLQLSTLPPAAHDAAPLAALLARHSNGMAAKSLWGASGLEIDAFYRQLKVEMAQGWIVQPEVATVREVATR